MTSSLNSCDRNLAACCEFLFSRWTEYKVCISAYNEYLLVGVGDTASPMAGIWEDSNHNLILLPY